MENYDSDIIIHISTVHPTQKNKHQHFSTVGMQVENVLSSLVIDVNSNNIFSLEKITTLIDSKIHKEVITPP